MHPKHFKKHLAHDSLVETIRQAESKSTGQIRVVVVRRAVDDPVAAAQKEFLRQGLNHSPDRNGVLIFVAPRSHRFAVIGDEAVHAQCGDAFWQELANAMTGYFRQAQFREGIIHGVERAGELLARHFPKAK